MVVGYTADCNGLFQYEKHIFDWVEEILWTPLALVFFVLSLLEES